MCIACVCLAITRVLFGLSISIRWLSILILCYYRHTQNTEVLLFFFMFLANGSVTTLSIIFTIVKLIHFSVYSSFVLSIIYLLPWHVARESTLFYFVVHLSINSYLFDISYLYGKLLIGQMCSFLIAQQSGKFV